MTVAAQIEREIAQGLDCRLVQVAGDDGRHFEALVVSDAFVGKTRVQQHQLVYAALGGRMQHEIHALAIRTLTPEQWAAIGK